METQGQGLGHDGQRSPPPPPPPPPPDDDSQTSSHDQESLEIKEEVDVVNQESDQGAAAAASLVDNHGDVGEEQEEEGAGDEEEGATAAAQPEEGPTVLTDDLRDKIVRQVEYYFSDENLPNDKFMLKHVKKDKQGFVPITVIASFRRMKRLVRDLSLIEAALRTSSQLVVSKSGRKVRRLHPLPVGEVKDPMSCTVIVENLPEDYSKDNLQKIFGNVGKILNITIHDPHSTEESKPTRKTEKSFSNKLHALIEYETTEAAANAVATLNDEKNWRSGMRVELLRKRLGKYGLIQRGHKETFSEKNSDIQTSEMVSDGQKLKSDDHHVETAEKEEEEHIAGGKGKCRSRYRSRGWGQQNVTGQGHGQNPSGSSNGVSKPPLGPRMPDGTRGFTMGRGKSAISEPNQNGYKIHEISNEFVDGPTNSMASNGNDTCDSHWLGPLDATVHTRSFVSGRHKSKKGWQLKYCNDQRSESSLSYFPPFPRFQNKKTNIPTGNSINKIQIQIQIPRNQDLASIMSSSSPTPYSLRLGFRQTLIRRSSPPLPPAISSAAAFGPCSLVKPHGLKFGFRRSILPIAGTDENFMGIPTLLDESISYGISDGEDMKEADRTYPSEDIDLPTCKDGLKISKPQKFASSRREGWRRRRIGPGVMINIALIVFLVTFLVIFDWHSWRIIRLPLGPFYLTHPFLISAVLSACAGWLYVPIVDSMNIHQILRKEGPAKHYIKKGTPTMGGLFFIPVGIVVARGIVGQSSIQLYGAAVTTLAFAAIGLLDDLLSCMKGHNYGLPGWTKLFLQVAVGTWFSFWLDSATMTTPYNMKHLVPLPAPLGLVHLGKAYLVLTAFCFASMGNGVNLTDGLDGLAGGVAAWAFIGMSVAVLAICPDLAIFGASMAGACVGFLFHNRYKASIFMGDTGSLALGGALAAMASCTGMFFPLFISSGVFVMEVLSVMVQVSTVKITKRLYGDARRILRMAPLHHHFELCGFKEPIIVASAYFISFIFAVCAGYIGLISA